MPGTKNTYDSRDRVSRHTMLRAGALKMASYRVRDPETDEWSTLQFHVTYDNTVEAVMGEEAAKLFVTFVTGALPDYCPIGFVRAPKVPPSEPQP